MVTCAAAKADTAGGPRVKSLKKSIGALDAEAATKLASLASDITMMVGRDGVIKDLSICNDNLSKDADITSWIGKPWIETVTIESRPKIELLLRDAASGARQGPQWRQVNHPLGSGRTDLPMRYAVMPIRANGPIVALGRELRSMSLLQQKLLETQQAVEREFARVRYAEMRYRTLFQHSGEAVVILDASTLRVVEANVAAQRLLGPLVKRIAGKAFTELFEGANQHAVQKSVDVLRASGRGDPVTVRLGAAQSEVTLSGSLLRQEQSTQLLVRLMPADAPGAADAAIAETSLRSLVERMPDAFVVTDPDHKVVVANGAFLTLAELAAFDQARGQDIGRWMGRSPAEINLLIENMREHGAVRRFPTIIRGDLGSNEEVEVSAVAVEEGAHPTYGFTIRAAGRSAMTDPGPNGQIPYSVHQLKGLVGQVPLKNLVRETTDLIERMCIEAALQIVGDNRASAAEMLGLSRQSLYLKLRRYGLGDLGADE